ncbi:MAG: TolC family protein [Thermodesulfobacteriota bacterium]
MAQGYASLLRAGSTAGKNAGLLSRAVRPLFVKLIVPALFLLVSHGLAEAAAMEVTLEDAYRLAVKSHESVRIAGEGIAQARSGVGKATAPMLPHFTAEGAYTQYNTKKTVSGFLLQPDNSSRVDLTASQLIFSGGTEWNARRAAKLNLRRTRRELDFAKETAMLFTARAYFGLLKSEKDVEIKEAALKRALERRKVARGRFRVGEVTKSNVLRAEAEVAEAEAELIKARNSTRNAGNLLKRFLGIKGEVSVRQPEIKSEVSGEVEDFISTAFRKRLDLRESAIDRDIASVGILAAWGGFLPRLTLEGTYSRREQDPTTSFLLKESISGALVLTFPIFEGGLRRAELSEAKSKLREEDLKLMGLKKDIEIEVREAYNNVREKEAVIESVKRQRSFAREDYRMVFEQFKAGLATTVDVIDSDAELVSAERSLMNARFDMLLSVVELKYASGVLREELTR